MKHLASLNIKLISAVYGAPDNPKKQMDMKPILQQRLDALDFDLAATNQLAGRDPAQGIRKVLVIKYSINGKSVTKTVEENNTIHWE